MGSPLPLPFREVEAWCRLYDVELEVWELNVLDELDGIALQVAIKNAKMKGDS